MSSRASTVVTLVLLGSALAFIGWYLYREMHDPNYRSGGSPYYGYHGYHGGYYSLFGGGSRGPAGGTARSSGSVTSRGGFGAAGPGAGG